MDNGVQGPGWRLHSEWTLRGGGWDLTWGIKESFRAYFERLPDHVYDLTGGATRAGGGEFRFPQGAGGGLAADGRQTFPFSGRVVLSAHFGAMSVMIADPELVVDPQGGATLSAVVDEDGSQPVRMVIADLAFEGMTGIPEAPQACFSAALASGGQYLFMGNYYAGDPLDPVSLRLVPPPGVVRRSTCRAGGASKCA